jgi:peptidoglycan hydrolase-like protein with peptidoglycan-binding domain
MAYSLNWLPTVLLRAGLRVAEVPGWQDRGLGDVKQIQGVLCHHTGGTRPGNMPALRTLLEGRPDLRGPLAQLGLGRDGTYYVVAAGKAQHAGKGIWAGISAGNDHFIGIEAQHSGLPGDPWPDVQMRAYQHGVAAILGHLGLDPERCAGHKEYAPTRKPDPRFDMRVFRSTVRDILAGRTPAPMPISSIEPVSQRPTLYRGAVSPDVKSLQGLLKLVQTETFDAHTEAAVREFQRKQGLVPDGIVGPKSWAKLDEIATHSVAAE